MGKRLLKNTGLAAAMALVLVGLAARGAETAQAIQSVLLKVGTPSNPTTLTATNGRLDVQVSGTIAKGTQTADAPAISTTATWNNAAVTFTHWLANVTDTASASGSKLLDLQVGGSSKFNVNKSGKGTFAADVFATDYQATGARFFYWAARSMMSAPSDGAWKLENSTQGNNFTLTLDDAKTTLSAEGVSVANNAIIDLGGAGGAFNGLFTFLISGSSTFCEFQLRGTSTREARDPDALCSITAGTASSINVYWDAGDNRFELQNLTGSTQTITTAGFGK